MSGCCAFWRRAFAGAILLALATTGRAADSVTVQNARQLALAFTNEAVSVIQVAVPFLNLTDADWEGIQPLPLPLSVRRNLTLTGDPALPEWPMLVLWSRNKVMLTNGATLTLKEILLYRYKHDVGLQGPGLDLMAPTPPEGPPAFLVFHNVVTVLGTYRGHTVAELEILGRCRHPNVVRLLAACLDPPCPFIVLEKMETSLDKLLYGKGGAKPSKPLPFQLVLKIAREVACGLEYLHPTVLHRDLKPANVLISDPWGPAPVVKLSDFGVSRLRASVLRTATPEAGTPAYLAPECFDISDPDLSHKADIWSFGTLLWECLAGEPPWWGLTIMEIAVNVTMRRVRLPLIPTNTPGGADPNRWPPRLVRLLGECLESDPLRRPAAAELVKRLALVQEGVDLAAAAPQAGQAPADA